MGRIISTDVLMKTIDKHTNNVGQLEKNIAYIVEEVPTAFDIEKVLMWMKDAKSELLKKATNSMERYSGIEDAMAMAVKIIKQGGYSIWENHQSEAEIRRKAINEFAEKLKDYIAKQVEDAECSNDLCTEIFQSEIDEIAELLKEWQ